MVIFQLDVVHNQANKLPLKSMDEKSSSSVAHARVLSFISHKMALAALRATLHVGPNGCQPKSSRFLPIGLLKIVKMGPRALHWGPIQISHIPNGGLCGTNLAPKLWA
jgi:hypothetical protein